MTLSGRFVHRTAWAALLVIVLASALVAAPAAAEPNYETQAYYSAVRDKPYAAYTAEDEFQRTSTVAYYSVVKDKPYAGYTDVEQRRRSSIVAYFTVVHDLPYAAYTSAGEFKRTSILPYYSVLH